MYGHSRIRFYVCRENDKFWLRLAHHAESHQPGLLRVYHGITNPKNYGKMEAYLDRLNKTGEDFDPNHFHESFEVEAQICIGRFYSEIVEEIEKENRRRNR